MRTCFRPARAALPLISMLIAAVGTAPLVQPALAASPPGTFFQGFEQNTNGWFDGNDKKIVRRPSGYVSPTGYASGVPSAAGRWHARAEDTGTLCMTDCDGPFTRWGGYSATFPPGGYLTQLDIYLDTAWAASHHTATKDWRVDWISAINNNAGTFLRDFVFNIGTTPTGYIVQSSTNSGRSGANPNSPCPSPNSANPPNTCRPPVLINNSGWYTFRHTFRDSAGTLTVDFDIFRQDTGAPIAHWTIFADPMSTVGGNRYGWFANEEIEDLAFDNSLRTGLCRKGDGQGDVEDQDGHKHHTKFHGNQCGDSGEGAQDDDDSGHHFESSSVNSATFTYDEGSQTMTMVGSGTDDGLPVAFTLVSVDFGGVSPALYTLTLSDGRVINASLIDGAISIQ